MKLRTFFIGIAALAMAIIGAYFSIMGLSALFSGAQTEVMFMAGVMEFAKIVTASFVYLYWDKLKIIMKSYLIISIFVLVSITSIGIYGFLTSAFQSTADELSILDQRVEVIESRKDRINEQISSYISERESVTSTILSLSDGLSGNVIQYVDQETGQLVTTTSSATRNVLTTQLENAQQRRELLTTRVESYTDSLASYDEQIFHLREGTNVASELGPLTFISDVLNIPMSTVVNVLALLIMFSFDPLAITLVIAFNMSIVYTKIEKDKLFEVYGEQKEEDKNNYQKSTVTSDNKKQVEESIIVDTTDVQQNENEPEVVKEEVKESEPKKVINEENTPKLKKKVGRVPVHLDKGSVNIDGYDTNGDGLIDIPSHSMKGRLAKIKKPYYAEPNFDWSDRSKWDTDQAAVNYWFTHNQPSSSYSKYPTDFDSKIY